MSITSKISPDSRFNMQKNDKCYKEFHELLNRVKENSIEPFQFLNNVLKEVNDDDDIQRSMKRTTYTDIDFQLASLMKRIESNVSILEKTKQRIKDINFITEKNKILASSELSDNKETSQINEQEKLKIELSNEHPEIDAVQHMLNSTLQIVQGIKKITIDDLDSKMH
ncbi:uncharacterized protein LOC122500251 isoform X2 [Leptopilina heterotoma]|uniref:uncharacterized protein LOC122500251 isoform X2 n=1 Tax=Leptopilina heterotoma TaxID=63436 RepID=UPI001CA9B0AF|nr:uncharacterized protein LOC122500251 isoform X2 [Leptopilina heterotoma]